MPDTDVFVRETEQERRIEELFEAYRSDIVAYCGWRAGSRSDAQDAVAEVFLAAANRRGGTP
jgi:DNA-directed RNA polymerase specialized sigma24 family protein